MRRVEGDVAEGEEPTGGRVTAAGRTGVSSKQTVLREAIGGPGDGLTVYGQDGRYLRDAEVGVVAYDAPDPRLEGRQVRWVEEKHL